MTHEELYRIAGDATREEELRSTEIPAIDLYMDQILNLVSDKVRQSSERYQDRQLTKTMINNYSKDGLITPVKGKKYNKEQILQILTIYTLKNTLSIGEIKRMLNGAYELEGFDGETLAKLYDRYQDVKHANRDYTLEILSTIMEREGLAIENEMDFMLTVGGLLSLSAFLRQTAQAMIDAKYPIPEEPDEDSEDKDKEKKKEEKKEKKEEKKEEKAKEKEKEEKEKEEKKERKEEKKEAKAKKKTEEPITAPTQEASPNEA